MFMPNFRNYTFGSFLVTYKLGFRPEDNESGMDREM